MSTHTQFWREASRLFAAALEHTDAEEFVANECADRPDLAGAVRGLLQSHARFSSTADLVGAQLLENALAPDWMDPALPAGEDVGAYRIEGMLGRGGMGHVYLATRELEGNRQRVALKVASRASRGDVLLRQLRRERRILAALEHPNIARLIDFGELPDGRPYFAMEYVDGVTITEYCAQAKLDVPARLRLFLAAAEAVSYAHRHLVLHRDLKPGNLLVDAEGRPRLLDFGIAKPLSAERSAVDQTQDGQRFFSPASAAPEQILNQETGVATDVYGLGCVLYEMLAGAAPFVFDARESRAAAERAVLERDPPLPSAVVRDPPVARVLRGDLDAITAKCLRKAPEARYRSVDAVCDDLRAVLESRPISIRGGERWYRARRALRRHRATVALAAALAVVTLAFAATTLVQARRVTIERDAAVRARAIAETQGQHAQAIVGFLVESFRNADPTRSLGKKLTAEELLGTAARAVPSRLHDQPEVAAAVAQTLALLFLRIDNVDEGRAQAALARDLLARMDAPPRLRVAQYVVDANLAFVEADYARLRTLAQQGLDVLAQEPGAADPDALFELWSWKATSRQATASAAEAAQAWDEAIVALGAAGVAPRRLATLKAAKARALGEMDVPHQRQSLELLREVFAWQTANLDANDNERLTSELALSDTESGLGLYADAEVHARDVVQRRSAIYGDSSMVVAKTKNSLAVILEQLGRDAEAEPLLSSVTETATARLGPEYPFAAGMHHHLALFYFNNRHDYRRADQEFREALRWLPVKLGSDHFDVAQARAHYAILLLALQRTAEAEAQLAAALPVLAATPGAASDVNDANAALAIVRARQGRRSEATALLGRALTDVRANHAAHEPLRRLVEAAAAGLPLPAEESGPPRESAE